MTPIDHSPLGRKVTYPGRFDAGLLHAIPRALGRGALRIADDALPFVGHDRWHAYELSWLDARGKPQVATGTLMVPADTPNLIESKSLKLYLNSCNNARFADAASFRSQVVADLSQAAGAPIAMTFGVPDLQAPQAHSLDGLDIGIDAYGPPDPGLLAIDAARYADETLHSALLKSNCPVTGQPDWADVFIDYRGPRIERDGLLRYLVGFREHAGFHEQCVEAIFRDIAAQCRPSRLSVEARYTRRGGLDINPWRATPGILPPPAGRSPRQ